MKKSATIKAAKRGSQTKGEMREMRESGVLPGSLSSRGEDSLTISVDRAELFKLLAEHGKSSVLKLKVGSKTYNAMVKEMQFAPLSNVCMHVTFQHVFLDEETTAEVPLHAHGRDALIHKGFEFLQQLDVLPVTGLPNDIPTNISIDVSNMEPGETLYVKDLSLPKGIKADMEAERVVLTVSHPRLQKEEEEETEEEVAGAEVPLVDAKDETPEE